MTELRGIEALGLMHDDHAVSSRYGLDDPVAAGDFVFGFEPPLPGLAQRQAEILMIADGPSEVQRDIVDDCGRAPLSWIS